MMKIHPIIKFIVKIITVLPIIGNGIIKLVEKLQEELGDGL